MSYDRRYRIFVDGEPFIDGGEGRQFRIVFSLSTGNLNYMGTGDLAIYNLAQDTANALKTDAVVTIEAGYVGNTGVIYSGKIRNLLVERVNTDTITRLMMVDETLPSQQLSHTFAPGTRVDEVIRYCAAVAGYPIEIVDADFADAPVLTRGREFDRDALDVLEMLGEEYGFDAFIQRGQLIIVKDGKTRGTDPMIINVESGLEMMPELSALGTDVTVRLNPQLAVGKTFIVESEYRTYNESNYMFDTQEYFGKQYANGLHKIFSIQHVGDSWGDAWSSSIVGRRVSSQ